MSDSKKGIPTVKLTGIAIGNKLEVGRAKGSGFARQYPSTDSVSDMSVFGHVQLIVSGYANRMIATLKQAGHTAFKAIKVEDTALPLVGNSIVDCAIVCGLLSPADFAMSSKDRDASPRFKGLYNGVNTRPPLGSQRTYAVGTAKGQRGFEVSEVTPKTQGQINALVKAGFVGFIDCKPNETRYAGTGFKALIPAPSTDTKHTVSTKTEKAKGKAKKVDTVKTVTPKKAVKVKTPVTASVNPVEVKPEVTAV